MKILQFFSKLFFPKRKKIDSMPQQEPLQNSEIEYSPELLSCRIDMKPINITYNSESEILDLVKAFEEKTLPVAEWTHLAHLTVAVYYIKTCSLEEAQRRLRTCIKAYNEAVGITNSPTSGYHETITIFWTKFLDFFFQSMPQSDLLAACNILVASENMLNKAYLLQFYSPELINSSKARTEWVAPDKVSLNSSPFAFLN